MEYQRVAEIACHLSPSKGSVIHYHKSVEVSFDCLNRKRIRRTIRFGGVAATGICEFAKKCDGFPGRLFSVQLFDSDGRSFVKYQIQYNYTPFVDLENGNDSVCEPTWARVSFEVVCGKCGKSTIHSTQNNLVRPHLVYCACGSHLYDDTEEMPMLRTHIGDPT